MDNSLASWLRLRECADTAARSASVTRAITSVIGAGKSVKVLDLATGTGSNLRFLVPRLSGRQSWLVVDRDPTVLAEVQARTSAWGAPRRYEVRADAGGFIIYGDRLECKVETRQLDLGNLDELNMFAGRDIVTASALLDLVSETWLATLVAGCKAVGAAGLFAMTYNGYSCCSPLEPEDDMVRNLLNRHQKTDKGLGGQAAGPAAAECAVRAFAEAGYRVRTAPSDWTLGSGERELQHQLIEGWAEAATAMAPGDAEQVKRWRGRRLAHVEADRSRLVVGHLDVAAWLPRD
jgi:hypothetical protein